MFKSGIVIQGENAQGTFHCFFFSDFLMLKGLGHWKEFKEFEKIFKKFIFSLMQLPA
jgi:hypothetical protein